MSSVTFASHQEFPTSFTNRCNLARVTEALSRLHIPPIHTAKTEFSAVHGA
jgi:hypothetical protein